MGDDEHSKDADAHYGFGVVLMQLRRFDDAQMELQRAVTLQPDTKEAYGDLAVAAAENKDFAGAIQALDARSRLLRAMQVADMLDQVIRGKLLERGLVCQDESHDVMPDSDQDDDGD